MTDLNSGEGGVIVKIVDEKPNILKALDSLGLIPKSYVKVEGKESFTGPLVIHVNGKRHLVERKLAVHVYVKPSTTASGGKKRA